MTGAVGSVTSFGTLVADITTAVWSAGSRTLTAFSFGSAYATAAKLLAYVRLLARKDSAIATDHATELTEINANVASGAGGYLNTSDSLEARADAGITLSEQNIADIAAGVAEEIDIATPSQIAAALTGVGTVQLLGPLTAEGRHTFLIGSAYSRALGIYPWIRLAKAIYNIGGGAAEFRCKTSGKPDRIFTAAIVSYDSNYWEVYCDLTSAQSATLDQGMGIDQFWVKPSGASEFTGVTENVLTVKDGIGVD